jgi:hypothetical protein
MLINSDAAGASTGDYPMRAPAVNKEPDARTPQAINHAAAVS